MVSTTQAIGTGLRLFVRFASRSIHIYLLLLGIMPSFLHHYPLRGDGSWLANVAIAGDGDTDGGDTFDAGDKSSSCHAEIAAQRIFLFELDSLCNDGRVLLCFFPGDISNPVVYFQDLSNRLFFVAANVTSYFSCMLLHFGINNWQYAFTQVGLTPQTQVR
jgi:hypothetical protein